MGWKLDWIHCQYVQNYCWYLHKYLHTMWSEGDAGESKWDCHSPGPHETLIRLIKVMPLISNHETICNSELNQKLGPCSTYDVVTPRAPASVHTAQHISMVRPHPTYYPNIALFSRSSSDSETVPARSTLTHTPQWYWWSRFEGNVSETNSLTHYPTHNGQRRRSSGFLAEGSFYVPDHSLRSRWSVAKKTERSFPSFNK